VKPVATAEGAFAIERMIDVDADILTSFHHVFAASFQGKIAAFSQEGKLRWSHDLSSYTGMTTDGETVYITDAKGALWAFDAITGAVRFHQTVLLARGLSAPVMFQNHVVVGDRLGYLHWLNKETGRIVARTSLGSPIIATPIVDSNQLHVLTQHGKLSSFSM
jgi:outer membrane protein assembly factor BamB